MKKLLLILLLLVTVKVQAQNWQEWTRQKKTQIKYLVDQIAALNVYAAFVEKGYDIAKKGLNVIGNIKKGDFSLHEEYFSSLRNVNAKIKSYWKVGGTIDLQLKIVQICHQHIKYLSNSSQLTATEIKYCKKVTDGVLKNCQEILGRLMTVITDGDLSLKDDERIRHIDLLYSGMKDNYVFVRQFTDESSWLLTERKLEGNDVIVSRALLNIPQ